MVKQTTIALFIIAFLGCKHSVKHPFTHESIKIETDNIYNQLVEVRRKLHQYPEFAGNEKNSQKIIEEYLNNLGVEILPNVYGYGVIGVIKGNGEGKKIAWRADMDALPHDFPDDVEFKSKNKGVQHVCGHDVHMAIGLGIAEVFSKFKESICGSVYFIFQPEEETFIGAKKMMDNGIISNLGLNEIYALHVTALPVGKIMVKPNEMYAYQKRVQIKLKNQITKCEHEELYKKVEIELSRFRPKSKPWEIHNVFDESIGLTNPSTEFKDYRFMDSNPIISVKDEHIYIKANLYETNQNNLPEILPKINEVINNTRHKDLLVSVSYIQENPTVMNDEELTSKTIKILSQIYGDDMMLPDHGQIPYFNDDFCYFQQSIPGVYLLLGGSNKDKGIIALNHAPNFMVDEESIRVGVKTFSSLILERLNEKQ